MTERYLVKIEDFNAWIFIKTLYGLEKVLEYVKMLKYMIDKGLNIEDACKIISHIAYYAKIIPPSENPENYDHKGIIIVKFKPTFELYYVENIENAKIEKAKELYTYNEEKVKKELEETTRELEQTKTNPETIQKLKQIILRP